MNQGNNNSNGKVKSKFFNQDLFDEANVNDVGSSTSGQVISWGVGGNKNTIQNTDSFSIQDSTQMFNFVNTEVTEFVENNQEQFDSKNFNNPIGDTNPIQNEIVNNRPNFDNNVSDVLNDIKFDSSTINNNISNEFASFNPTFYGYNANPQIMQNEQMNQNSNIIQPQDIQISNNTIEAPSFDPFNSLAEPATSYNQETTQISSQDNNVDFQMQPLFAMAIESQNSQQPSNNFDLNPLNYNSEAIEIDETMRSNQPLSMMALSGETIDESQKPKDVLENSKYFQTTPLEDNRLKVEEIIPPPAPAIDVLATPTRDLNIRELTVSYVGPKYQKISMSPFSFCGAFFTSLYYFFRKMYLQGLILMVINAILNIISNKNFVIGLGLYLGEFIIIGLLTNSIYLSHAEKEVKKIAAQNPNMNQYELQRICSNKGGTSLLMALLISMGISIITSPIINAISPPAWQSMLDENPQATIETDKTASLDEVITYQLPTEFTRKDSGPYPFIIEEEKWIRGKKLTLTSCAFNIYLVGGADTSKEFLQDMADKEQRYNKVSKEDLGEQGIWDSYTYDTNEYYYTYLAQKIKGHIVLVSYRTDARATDNMCETHLKNIMSSIEKK